MTPPAARSQPNGYTQWMWLRPWGTLAVTLATLACLAAFVPLTVSSNPDMVDPNNPAASDTIPATEKAPFASLEEALDAAEPGDTILLIVGQDATVYLVQPSEGGEPETGTGDMDVAAAFIGEDGGPDLGLVLAVGGLAIFVVISLLGYFLVIQPRRKRRPLLEALEIVNQDRETEFGKAEALVNEALVAGLKADDVREARFALAYLRARREQYAEASTVLADLLAEGTTDPHVLYLHMWLSCRLEDYAAVETTYSRHSGVLEDFLDSRMLAGLAFLHRARTLWKRGELEGAMKAFDRIRRLSVLEDQIPAHTDEHAVALGVQALFQEKPEEARKRFEASVEAAKASGASTIRGELGCLLCDWCAGRVSGVDEGLGDVLEALRQSAGPLPEGLVDPDEELPDDLLLLRNGSLWHGIALLKSWLQRPEGERPSAEDLQSLRERLDRVRAVDPRMPDPVLVRGLVDYYFASQEVDDLKQAIEALSEAVDLGVSLPEVLNLVKRLKGLLKKLENSLETYLELVQSYAEDSRVPDGLRRELLAYLSNFSRFQNQLQGIEVKGMPVTAPAPMDQVRHRGTVIMSRVRGLLGARLAASDDDQQAMSERIEDFEARIEQLGESVRLFHAEEQRLVRLTGEYLLADDRWVESPDGNGPKEADDA